ncbi:MAG TPA: ComF family protein [Polyangia bacterium]
MLFDRLLPRILPILWPARCAGCSGFVAEGTSFCRDCEVSVLQLGHCCPGCAMPNEGGAWCGGCRRAPFPFARASAALVYGGALTQALLHFKHGGHRYLARPLAPYLSPLLAAAAEEGASFACPVPLHPHRLRQRGYNQVLELLRAAGKALPRQQEIEVIADALSRTIDTPILGRQSPTRRRQMVANAFTCARPRSVAGKCILVVDDVMTTGATLSECARTLLASGASRVMVAALARAID